MQPTDLYTILQNSIVSLEPLIQAYLCDPPKGCVADRVAIYAEGFYIRLEETLVNDYTTLATVMGERKFSDMSRLYTSKYPSHNYSLNFFGEKLSLFLTETSPYSNKPQLAEIASFEWAEYQSLVARDTDLLSVSDLQSLPINQWPDMTFSLHPSCQIIPMEWNSLAIIHASRANKPLPKPKKLKVPQSLLIWRRNLDVRFCKLESIELITLNAIKKKSSFISICELLSCEMPDDDVPSYVVKELYAWLQEQLFAKE